MTHRMSFLLLLVPLIACGAAERAAARDPMKCERDPKCASKNAKDKDCATQCSDDPACMDRCREMQVDPGVGHR